ncbi:LysR family transcriptional regulator [Klebsiella variicola]|uniref:LysR family transcriptional regulator n=1 Tax=Klebsiella variicola TaxID=244366 RepID=A0A7H4MHS6_KLEVA|nr:LysR family transcriptional regulator [Klebsiella variicola]
MWSLLKNYICIGRQSGYISPSPPSASRLNNSSQRLGVVLFSRANRRLTLTAAGEAFLQKTRLALEMADQAVLDAQRTARGEQGRLHLGYVSSAMYDSKLPGLLRELRADWRGLSCRWCRGMCKMLYEALLDLRLDIAIIRAPLASPPDALVVRPFVREKTLPGALSTASAGRRGGAQSGLVAH